MFTTLIVDDSASFRESLRENLSKHFPSMVIAEAAGVQEGLKKVDALLPDLIFVDIKLAGENGLELARKVRTEHGDTIIAIITSYDLPEFREAAEQSGANFFFSKGRSTVEEVIALIDSASSGHERIPIP